MHASLRGGGDTIPSEVARRGLGVGRGRSSPLPPPPAAPPSTRRPLPARPSRRSTCRAGPGSPAAEERTRAPHPRALPRTSARSHPRPLLIHFKVHSQNSQTFSAQRGVSLGEEARTSCFSLLPREDEGRVPAQSLRQHQFHARTRRMCGEGVGEGERVWGRKAAPRRVGWGGVGVVKRRSEVPTLGLRSFKSVSKKGRAGKKLFQCLSLLLLGAPSAPRSRDWLLPARPLFPKCDNP